MESIAVAFDDWAVPKLVADSFTRACRTTTLFDVDMIIAEEMRCIRGELGDSAEIVSLGFFAFPFKETIQRLAKQLALIEESPLRTVKVDREVISNRSCCGFCHSHTKLAYLCGHRVMSWHCLEHYKEATEDGDDTIQFTLLGDWNLLKLEAGVVEEVGEVAEGGGFFSLECHCRNPPPPHTQPF